MSSSSLLALKSITLMSRKHAEEETPTIGAVPTEIQRLKEIINGQILCFF